MATLRCFTMAAIMLMVPMGLSTDAWADTEASSSELRITVELTNGVQFVGTAAQADLMAWVPGQPIAFTPEGGELTTIEGSRIAAIHSGSAGSATTAPAVEETTPAPGPPRVEYSSPQGFSHPNPASSRHLYAPSAIPLKQGQGYVSQKYLAFSSVAYAPTDNLTLLFGAPTFFPPLMTILGGKFAGEVSEGVHLGAGVEVFMLPMDSTVLASIVFGAITLGDEDKQLTIATGKLGGEMFEDTVAVPVMIGGQMRLSDSVALITENWIIIDAEPGYQVAFDLGIYSAAVRLLGRRADDDLGRRRMRSPEGFPKTSWDLGMIVISDGGDDFFGPMPWVDWTWHFGPTGI